MVTNLNRNGRCDGGEPSATTGSGGVFTLETGDLSANDYPVVVEVRAGAIDEEAGPVAKGYTAARQIAALETSALDGAGGVLPGHTVYSFEEDGTSGLHPFPQVDLPR